MHNEPCGEGTSHEHSQINVKIEMFENWPFSGRFLMRIRKGSFLDKVGIVL